MNEFSELSTDMGDPKIIPRTAEELKAEYIPQVDFDEKGEPIPRGHLMTMRVNKPEARTRRVSSSFRKSKTEESEVIAAGSVKIYTNPSSPVEMEGEEGVEHAYVRREMKEHDSEVVICERIPPDGDEWVQDEEMPVFPGLQDPFHCGVVDGFQIFGGVKIKTKEDGELEWRTVFYKYKSSMKELRNADGTLVEPFCTGPLGMKDIRILQLHYDEEHPEKNRIAVFTRPQHGKGNFGGPGRIGYFEINNLSQLEGELEAHDHDSEENVASLIDGMFVEREWGGVNQLHKLRDGRIGVIGHIARIDEDTASKNYGVKDYFATAFVFDPATRTFSDLKVIATAEDFPKVEGTKQNIGSVVFSGGIKRLGNGRAIFYCGVRDVEAGYLPIEDPFGDL